MTEDQNRVVFVSNNFFRVAVRFQHVDASEWTFGKLFVKCNRTPLVYFSHRCRKYPSSVVALRLWRQVEALVKTDASKCTEHPSVGSVVGVLKRLVYDAWLKGLTLAAKSVMMGLRSNRWWGRGDHARKMNAGLFPGLGFYGIVRTAHQRGMPIKLATFAFSHLAQLILKSYAPSLCYASVIQGIIVGAWSDVALDAVGTQDPTNGWRFNFDATQALSNALYRMHVRTAREKYKDVHWFALKEMSTKHAVGLLKTSLTRICRRVPRELGIIAGLNQANNITRAKSVPAVGVFRVTNNELVNLAELSFAAPSGHTAKAAWEGLIRAISYSTDAWSLSSSMSSKCYSGINKMVRLVADRMHARGSKVTTPAAAKIVALTVRATGLDLAWNERLKKARPVEHLLSLHAAYHRLPAYNRMYAVRTTMFSKEWFTVLMAMKRASATGRLPELPHELLFIVANFSSPFAVSKGAVVGLLMCCKCFSRPAKYKHQSVLCAQCEG
jgi:hypothetical protein